LDFLEIENLGLLLGEVENNPIIGAGMIVQIPQPNLWYISGIAPK
jgi:hypothetical protein